MRKRILGLMLCCVMLLGLMPTTAFAEGTGKAIQLGTSGIFGYDTAKGGTGYDYIYMGSYNSSPVKWRVLDDQTNFDSNGDGTNETGLFLLSEDLLGSGGRGDVYFDGTSPYSNAWQGSDAQACGAIHLKAAISIAWNSLQSLQQRKATTHLRAAHITFPLLLLPIF